MRGGRLREVVAKGGSTVVAFQQPFGITFGHQEKKMYILRATLHIK